MARSHRYNKSGPLKGGVSSYMPSNSAQAFTLREARAEYARLRREANRRLEVLRRSKFSNLAAVQNRPGTFEALERGASEREVRYKLSEVAQFLNLRTSSLEGARKSRRQFINTMQERGYDFVNDSNADDFGRFMGQVQKHREAKGYDSDQVVELFQQAEKKNIDPQTLADDFEFWLEHSKELEAAPKASRTLTSEQFAAAINLSIDT